MKNFEVAQGRRGHDLPSGLGPSLGPTVKQGVCGPGRRVRLGTGRGAAVTSAVI